MQFCRKCEAPLLIRQDEKGVALKCSNPACDIFQPLDKYGDPRGPQVDNELKAARREAHRYFDQIWTRGFMSRPIAYRWLERLLRVHHSQAHIGKLDLAHVNLIIKYSKAYLASRDNPKKQNPT